MNLIHSCLILILSLIFAIKKVDSACTNFYTLFPSDSCSSLVTVFQISVQNLLSFNPGLDCANLVSGTTICVAFTNDNPTPSPTPTCTNYYQVFAGDSCEGIAAGYRTTIQILQSLNPGLNCQNLPVGTNICVPVVDSNQPINPIGNCNNYYQLYQGDSCDSIATAFRTNIQTLLSLNPGLNCQNLPIGTNICVPVIDQSQINPVNPVSPTCSNFYTLFNGDTCDSIANAFQTTVQNILTLNPSLNCQNLPFGTTICVSSSSSNPVNPVIPTCSNYYTLFSSDTCDSIAAAFRTTVQALLSLNPNLNCQNLPIGQQICVPQIQQPINPTPAPTCTNFYTLFAGDTCDSIATAFRTTIQAILSLNPNLNCQALPIGQQICVPPSQQPINPTCSNFYTLFSGDTCEGIAAAFRITVQALLSLNPNLNCQNLQAGQQICVPTIDQPINPNPPSTCTNFYTVFPGDTCDSIASAFRTTVQNLLSLNPNLNCQSLPIGQQICVPNVDSVNPNNPNTCANYYTLFQGDTCDSIAAAFKITVQALLALNPTLNCQSLPTGSLICVPSVDGNNPVNPIQGCSFFYVIFSGDTCDSLATAFKTTVQTLLSLNPTLNCQSLPIGQTICVPSVDNNFPINPINTCSNFYTLFAGDTCDSIAAAFKITVQDLIGLNPTLNCQNLPIGQTICVPTANNVNPVCNNFYTVFNGDTCNSIAIAYKTTIQGLLSLNPTLNCNFLPIGQQICVPSVDTTPVTPVIPVSPTCNYLYTLFPGDSCDSIALAYKTTVVTLITLNPTLNCQNLPIGQKICVPFVDSPNIPITPSCTNYYTIFGTDTCQSIALAYATTIDVLLSLNPSLNCNHLPFGTTICVPQINNPLPTPAPVQPIQPCSNFYTTFYGDTCDKIALAYQTSVQYLQSLNPTLNCGHLQVGLVICVPSLLPVPVVPSCSNYYKIFSSDTCNGIAVAFKTTIENLCQLNPGLNCNSLPVGSAICVPNVNNIDNSNPFNVVTVPPINISPSCTTIYKVFTTDTCSGIALAFRTTVENLCQLNPGLNCNALPVGQNICVPSIDNQQFFPTQSFQTSTQATQSQPACSNWYTIFPVDKCENIALAFKTTVQNLCFLNPNLNCNQPLPVGQRICVPSLVNTAQPQQPTNPTILCPNFYTLFATDTCENLASAFRTTVQNLCQLNPGLNCNALPYGQRICVPKVDLNASPVPSASNCPNIYTTVNGDDCYLISITFKTNIDALRALNPQLNCQQVITGTPVCVPAVPGHYVASNFSCQTHYSVVAEDTCYDIAQRNSISLDQFYSLNPGIDCNNLQINQLVCVCGLSHDGSIIGIDSISVLNQCSLFYTISSGDICFNIAKRYGLSLKAFIQLNLGLNCQNLKVGQIVCLSTSNSNFNLNCPRINSVVKNEDTCYTLALKYKVDLSSLTNRYDCNLLKAGQQICL